MNSQTFFVKGIANTLKLNVSSFVTDLHQEIDKIHSIYVLEEELKLNLKLVEYLHRNIGGLVTAEKTVLKKEKKKLTTTLKTKSKQCSECGNEMVYVSEFKKHLECPYCSNVKRPNTKLQNWFIIFVSNLAISWNIGLLFKWINNINHNTHSSHINPSQWTVKIT